MFKNFSPLALSVLGRQSELIELALTYHFEGIEIDMEDFAKRAELRGLDHSRRLLDSAKIKIGEFQITTRWESEDIVFGVDLDKLPRLAEIANSIGAHGAYVTAMPATDAMSYDECLEFHRKRFTDIAAVFHKQGLKFGIGLQAAPSYRVDKKTPFIFEAAPLLQLIASVDSPNAGLALDTWQWRLGGGTLDQLRELGGDRIACVRMSHPVGEIGDEPDERQQDFPGQEGDTFNLEVLKLLAEIGYDGPVTPIAHPSQFKGRTRDKIVQSAAEGLNTMWEAAGLCPVEDEDEEGVAAASVVEDEGADGAAEKSAVGEQEA